MSNAFFQVPPPHNEPVLAYAPNSAERLELQAHISKIKNKHTEIASIIYGKTLPNDEKILIRPPHELNHILGHYCQADGQTVAKAIQTALAVKPQWENCSWEHRAAVFLKAADLLSGKYRPLINAATMLGQSKNVYQSEIDAACELADFFRFNVYFAQQIYLQQPISAPNVWNRLEYRALEGFVAAITPFNFTSICANLAAAPVLMGNVVVWKPSETQLYSAQVIMDLLKEAGLPDGVINMVICAPLEAGKVIFGSPDLAGLHFTGSTRAFQSMWQTVGANISKYKTYPRLVGETGGKDYVVAHSSAVPKAVAVALSRGAFEYQGQKCSAASRAYISKSIWPEVKKHLLEDLAAMKMGTVEDFGNFINAVIDEKSFDKITAYIATAHKDTTVEIIAGGKSDKTAGYFIQPTVIVVEDPNYVTMREEIFGPVLTIYVFEDKKWEATLDLVDKSSPYALTGALFATDRLIIEKTSQTLRHSAGNFYINDKPTGAVVGQQPFGGGRASGTNDKAGSMLNLLRWTSPRTIKENFVPALDFRYPFLKS